MKIKFAHDYISIISLENLLEAWREFVRGKRSRKDVQEFEINLMGNIIGLHNDLLTKNYRHSPYEAFNISDPKPRNIHKANVRDRLLHYAIYRRLYPFFDETFIADSYSCRLGKGTHKAMNRFRTFAYKVSQNHTRTVWVLKCDIKKFFASIDQEMLIKILKENILNEDIIWLLSQIIKSFNSGKSGKGLPLGNLTSQLLVNIYMNEFDQFMKHKLKIEHYIRYADDFVILSHEKSILEELLPKIGDYLSEELKLDLHPDKIFIKTISSGVDFLGWVHFTNHRVLRTSARNKMLRRLKYNFKPETIASYLGLLGHGNTYILKSKVSV